MGKRETLETRSKVGLVKNRLSRMARGFPQCKGEGQREGEGDGETERRREPWRDGESLGENPWQDPWCHTDHR